MLMRHKIPALAVVAAAAGTASATTAIQTIPCMVIAGVWEAIRSIAPALLTVFFLYGAAKYAYSADDPGGRKQGKSIAINALIGFLIVAASKAVVEAVANATVC
jgi:hypothetical protein